MTDTVSTITFDEALNAYRALFLTARNLALRTRQEYTTDLADLIAFLTTRSLLTRPNQVGKNHLEAYLAELDNRGMLGSTRRRKVASIRSFFAFLTEQGILEQNPSQRLIPPAREHYQPRVLSEGEYKRLVTVHVW